MTEKILSKQGSSNYPFWGNQTMQMYANVRQLYDGGVVKCTIAMQYGHAIVNMLKYSNTLLVTQLYRNCNEWQLQKQWKPCALNLEVLPWWSLWNASFEIHWLERWNGGPHGKLTCHPWKGRILGRIRIILQPSNYRGYSLVFRGVYHEEWLFFIPSMYGIFTYVGILRRRYAPYVWRVDIYICIYMYYWYL